MSNIDYDVFMAQWTREIPESEIRRLLRFQGKYYFAGGKPGCLPIETFSQILRELVDEHEKKWRSGDIKQKFEVLEDYNYGETGGKPFLKEVLAKRLRKMEDVDVSPENVTITSGSQQAIYALLDCVINPGDIIITPRPAYLGFLGPAVKLGATVVTVPTDLEGLIPEDLEDCMERCVRYYHRVPKIIYLVAYSDNPKGTTLPEKRKKAIFDIAEKYNCLIIDDEAYKYIQYDSPNGKIKPIKAYDKDNDRVAYLSTTSKEAAVFRLGYSVFPESLQTQIIKAKGYLDLCTPTLLQRIVAIYYDKYID
ncbi:MAG: aminotransferase class I/II-fold pyridoxal phosphate-dependent enzyme, partial [Candidatus Hodarchaeales archaeon]